jgi:hypothetical protein
MSNLGLRGILFLREFTELGSAIRWSVSQALAEPVNKPSGYLGLVAKRLHALCGLIALPIDRESSLRGILRVRGKPFKT